MPSIVTCAKVRSAGCRVAGAGRALMPEMLRGELLTPDAINMVVAWPAFRMMCILIGSDMSLVMSSANAATPGCRMACADVCRRLCFLKGACSCCTTSAWWWDGLPPVCCVFGLLVACFWSGDELTRCPLAAGWLCADVPALDIMYRLPAATQLCQCGAGWHAISAMCIWAASRVHWLVGRCITSCAGGGAAFAPVFLCHTAAGMQAQQHGEPHVVAGPFASCSTCLQAASSMAMIGTWHNVPMMECAGYRVALRRASCRQAGAAAQLHRGGGGSARHLYAVHYGCKRHACGRAN